MTESDQHPVCIPAKFLPGTSVNLLHVQAVEALTALARQQMYAGLHQLLHSTRELKSFVVNMEKDGDEFTISISNIEIAPDASEETKIGDLKKAITDFVEKSVPVILYQDVSGLRLEREILPNTDNDPSSHKLAIAAASHEAEMSSRIGDYQVGVPKDQCDTPYVRVRDVIKEREYVMDEAFLRARPDLGIKLLTEMAGALSNWKAAA